MPVWREKTQSCSARGLGAGGLRHLEAEKAGSVGRRAGGFCGERLKRKSSVAFLLFPPWNWRPDHVARERREGALAVWQVNGAERPGMGMTTPGSRQKARRESQGPSSRQLQTRRDGGRSRADGHVQV